MTTKAGLIGFFIILLTIAPTIAPNAEPYDNYDIDSYNCLHIARECQEWHEYNGINTTVIIGLFNETHGHAWLINTSTGKVITGYVPEWEYIRTYRVGRSEIYKLGGKKE